MNTTEEEKKIMPCIVLYDPDTHLEYFEFHLPGNQKVILSAQAVDGWLRAHPNLSFCNVMFTLYEHNQRLDPLQLEIGIRKKGP